jgi:hypothetical protein
MNIKNYQEDVINKLKIHKARDHSSRYDAFKMFDGYKDDFECVSTLTDEIIKPDYKITDDHIILTIQIPRDDDLFRFNKLQLMEDNVVIDNVVDNSFIKKIQLVIEGKYIIIDDLEKFNIYFPILACPYQKIDIRVFIDKTSSRHNLDNIMLTYERVNLNPVIRFETAKQAYDIFEGVKRENGWIYKTDHIANGGNGGYISYLINQQMDSLHKD